MTSNVDAVPLTSTTAPPLYSSSPESPTRSISSGPRLYQELGFPGGYFLIRSVATGRVLDVTRGANDDGTDIILWTEKETSLVESMRDPESDNQLFFLDVNGNLCSKIAGLPVDIDDKKLIIRRHRPITYPFPNAFSHPLPRFRFNRSSRTLHVDFACDPSYPIPSTHPSQMWKEREYLLTSVPQRRPKSFLENTSNFFASAVSKIPLGSGFGAPATATSSVQLSTGEFDLRQDEIMEEERAVDEEDDDSLEHAREVRMLNLPLGSLDKEQNSRAVERRKWDVIPVLANRNVTRTQPRPWDG